MLVLLDHSAVTDKSQVVTTGSTPRRPSRGECGPHTLTTQPPPPQHSEHYCLTEFPGTLSVFQIYRTGHWSMALGLLLQSVQSQTQSRHVERMDISTERPNKPEPKQRKLEIAEMCPCTIMLFPQNFYVLFVWPLSVISRPGFARGRRGASWWPCPPSKAATALPCSCWRATCAWCYSSGQTQQGHCVSPKPK